MKIVTKMMTVVVSVMLTFAIGTTNAHAATDSGTFGKNGDNLTWTYDDVTRTLTISGTGEMEDWQTGYLTPWGSYQSEITTVIIQDGVTNIGNEAFSNYHALKSVTIADSVTDIRFHAFQGSENLDNIDLPGNLKTIGDAAFYGCHSLTDITIPDSVTTMGDSAFANCDNLTDVVIGENVESIGYQAFYHTNIQSINIPTNVKAIGTEAFAYTKIKEITIPRSVTDLGSGIFGYNADLKTIIYEGTEAQWYALTDGVRLGIEPSQVTFVFNPKWYVDYDLNGGSADFTLTTITVDDGFESLIPAWDEIKGYIHAPAGKEYAGVEVNGKKYNVGDNFTVKEDVVIKLLWNDAANNNSENGTNNSSANHAANAARTGSVSASPQTGDTIISNIIALLLSSVGILGGITYLLWRKRKLD